MRWCLIRHPDLAEPAAVAEDAVAHYEIRGYARVSGWADDPHLPIEQFPPHEDAPPPPALKPEPERKPAKTTTKESS